MKALLSMLYAALPYALVCLAVAALLWFTWASGRDSREAEHQRELTTLRQDHEGQLLRISAAQAKANGEAEARERAKERESARQIANIETKYQKESKDAKAISDRVIAGLRAGTVRVRQWPSVQPSFGGSHAIGAVREPGASPGLGDGTASGGPGAEIVGRVIGAGADGDQWGRQLLACQAILRSDRGEVKP